MLLNTQLNLDFSLAIDLNNLKNKLYYSYKKKVVKF